MERPARTATNLYYHALERGTRGSGKARQGFVGAGELRARIESLLASGARAVSMDRYAGGEAPGQGEFTISFDDAHPSVLEIAVPLLHELGVPATMFVPTRYPGETRFVMGWGEIGEVARAPGWTIGSHGAVHARAGWKLYGEGEPEQIARLECEARESRAEIERRLGILPSLYAYPFGEAPAVAREALRRAGFTAAFTVAQDPLWDGDRFAIPRIDGACPGPRESEAIGISVVVPACDRPAILRETVRRLSEQSYPAESFEVIVVDDGSRQDLARALEGMPGAEPRLIRLAGSDGTFRAGQARQLGAESARFGVVAFVDADVAVDRDYLWHVAWCHDGSPGTVLLGYLSGYNLHDRGWVHEIARIAREQRLTGDAVPVIPDRSREPALASCLDNVAELEEPWRLTYTGNMSVDRDLLMEVGGFSGDFSGWGFEDIDIGLRLHGAGGRFRFSRWALGYHMSEGGTAAAGGDRAAADRAVRISNPFRDPHPTRRKFEGVLQNLEVLQRRHEGNRAVADFCERVRSDIDEICDPPSSVGVEMGAGLPCDWPFQRLSPPHPGGVGLEDALDRLAYAKRLGVRHLYLLGGDVGMSPHLRAVLDEARSSGFSSVTIETTGLPFADRGIARDMACKGLSAAVVNVLAGRGHPQVPIGDRARAGVASLVRAGVRVEARIVLGADEPEAFESALGWCAGSGLELRSVTVAGIDEPAWLASRVPAGASVERTGHGY